MEMAKMNTLIPHPFTLVADMRPAIPWSVYAAPMDPADKKAEHRFAVLWDVDNDERVLHVALALYYASPQAFHLVRVYAEHRGHVTALQLGDHEMVERGLAAAISAAASALKDQWTMEVVERSDHESNVVIESINQLFGLGPSGTQATSEARWPRVQP
jgi:hypothetical protein